MAWDPEATCEADHLTSQMLIEWSCWLHPYLKSLPHWSGLKLEIKEWMSVDLLSMTCSPEWGLSRSVMCHPLLVCMSQVHALWTCLVLPSVKVVCQAGDLDHQFWLPGGQDRCLAKNLPERPPTKYVLCV